MPTVSVIIPTCNRPALLREAINSVFAQSYQDWEVIVVDDRPSEDTRAVATSYSTQVKYLRGEQAGPSRARNLGFTAAKGDLITFLDDDDLILPDNLETLSAHLAARSNIGCAYGWYAWIDPSMTITSRPGPQIAGATPVVLSSGQTIKPCGAWLQGDIFAPLLLEESLLLGNSLIHRSWVDRCGGFDPSVDYQEHWDFYLRLAQAGCRFFCSETMVSLHRLHQNSRTQTYDNRGQNYSQMLAGRIKVLDRFLKGDNLPPELSAVHDQAYYNAYREFFRLLLRQRRIPEWTAAFAGALEFAPNGPRDHDALAYDLSAGLLAIEEPDPVKAVDDLRRRLPASTAARRACHTAMGRVLLNRAIQANDHGASRVRVLGYLAKAGATDPRLITQRKMWSLVLKQLVTPSLQDWIKFSRRP